VAPPRATSWEEVYHLIHEYAASDINRRVSS
jgi:hypothetical protein